MRATEFVNKQQGVAEGSYREGGSITHDGVEYDFDSVMSIAEKMPTKTCSVDKLSWVLQYDTPNKERLERADITVPLIVTKSVNGKLAAIDGLHRLAKAVRDNVKTLPVKYIKPSELESAKLNKQGVAEVVSSQYQTILYEYATTQVIDKENIKVWKIERDPTFPPSEVIIKREMSKIRVHASVDNEYIKGKNAEHANDSVLLLRTWLKVVLEELPKFVKDDDTSIRIEAHGKRANIYERVMPKILTALQQVNPGWVYNESWVNNIGATFFTFTNYNYNKSRDKWIDKKTPQGVAESLLEETDYGNDQPLRLRANTDRAQKFIDTVYARYPDTFQNNHVMSWGSGDEQEIALFELVPNIARPNAVDIKWIQAYPLRRGIGSRSIKILQSMAQEHGVTLTLYPWDKGQVSQAKLIKFYRQMGFRPTSKGSKNMIWQGVAEGLLDRFKKKSQQPEDPSYKKGWELCNKDPSADPVHLFRRYGEGLDPNQFIKGFIDNAKSRGMKIHGDVRGDVDHSTLRYKEIMRDRGMAEDTLNEFAIDSGGGGDDILKTLAAQWLNGDVSSGDLDSDIQSQEKVERRLEKGVTCPDGVKRKLYIDYSDDYEGVVIYGDDNWSITYKQDDLSESQQGVAEAWSEKYKRSINCDNPRGFSQRAHCQGRKKNNEQIELDERKKKRKTTKNKTNRYFYGPAYYGGYYGTGEGSGDGGGGE